MNEEGCAPTAEAFYDRCFMFVNIAAEKYSVIVLFVIEPTLQYWTKVINMSKQLKDYNTHRYDVTLVSTPLFNSLPDARLTAVQGYATSDYGLKIVI